MHGKVGDTYENYKAMQCALQIFSIIAACEAYVRIFPPSSPLMEGNAFINPDALMKEINERRRNTSRLARESTKSTSANNSISCCWSCGGDRVVENRLRMWRGCGEVVNAGLYHWQTPERFRELQARAVSVMVKAISARDASISLKKNISGRQDLESCC